MRTLVQTSILERVLPVLLGLSLPLPIYVMVGGNPVFPLQIAVLVLLFFFVYLLPRQRGTRVSTMDQLVLAYVAWITISFLANLYSSISAGLFERQSVSYLTFLLLLVPYLVCRLAFTSSISLERYRRWFMFSLALILCYYYFRYARSIGDLYFARAFVKQRVPLLLAFGAWGCCSPLYWRNWRSASFLIWVAATGIVVLSLTRGAYLQWATCALLTGAYFLVIRKWRFASRKALRKTVFAVAFLLAVVLLFAWLGPKLGSPVSQITGRFQQILSPGQTARTDESASVRLEIWSQLWNVLVNHPIHLLVGYGQLGPSYLDSTFFSLNGKTISQMAAHSQYLDTLIRSGLPGLLLELAILGYAIVQPLRRLAGFPIFHQAQSLALAGVLVYGIFAETFRWQLFGFVIFAYLGMVAAWERKARVSGGASNVAQ